MGWTQRIDLAPHQLRGRRARRGGGPGRGSRISLGRPAKAVARVSQSRRNSVKAGCAAWAAWRARKARWSPSAAAGAALTGWPPRRDGLAPRPGRPVLLGGVRLGLVAVPLGVGDGRRDVAVGRHDLTRRVGVDDPDPLTVDANPSPRSRVLERRSTSASNPRRSRDQDLLERRPADRLAEDPLGRRGHGRSTADGAEEELRRAGLGVAVLDHAGQLDEVLVAREEQAPLRRAGRRATRSRRPARSVPSTARPADPRPTRTRSGSTFVTVSTGRAAHVQARPEQRRPMPPNRRRTPTWSGPMTVIPEPR